MSELKSFGESRRFALGFRLSKDPDSGVTIEDRQLIERLSWGEVQIWVGDRNLTLGRFADGDTTHSAQVPLFPIIEWLVNNWNPLLNEEALPRKSESVSAAEWKRASTQNLFGDSTEIDELLSDRELWWQRHSFGAALPGFRVPDFHIRRKGDQAELSWDDSDWRSIEGGVSLMEQPGSLLLPIDEVAKTLFEFSNGVLKAIHGLASQESIESESLSKLMTQLKNLEHPDHHFERIRWSARTDIEKLAKHLIKKSGIHEDEIESSVQTILGLSETRPVASLYAPLTLPTLLFRSASPALSLNDLEKL
ncbi:hypothetical protein KAI87_00090, partial [Myxococcota bacterium]|nr:hypothetical protein [Myxococcota bacterium]